ncbi:hypothetical protein H8K35_00840 [Undibacterium sp. LX40W]|uniref:Prokaryotic glutathione synthetase ATP-binding domain-containing protein n=1 Tax=Undibacterium nitidum TaxID=2762298 RepID=A0A923KTA0_9BURK|nr:MULTISPECIES: hypothetical protein [Undibacterium]MBC3881072.1 hypothetical protein [Undibacterium nitidum]MBC3890195.1 hypothetical protein [Undibacterium sp. LX40W]
MMKSVAIVTCADLPELFGGEKSLIPALKQLQMSPQVVVWDDPQVPWSTFDLILIRCTWDYHQKIAAFQAWLKMLSTLDALVVNDVSTMQWNLDKNYLFELQGKKCQVIPSIRLQPEDSRSLKALIDLMAVDEIVVKPTQSAGAWRTLRVNRENAAAHESEFNEWRREQSFLLQAFMPEIVSQGEWSLVFFDGQYSHSLLKRAKDGDFRVQSDHGGTVLPHQATQDMQQQAQTILQSLSKMPLYARVDGVMRAGKFMLMELELVEPELFLEVDPLAAQRFASAIHSRLAR